MSELNPTIRRIIKGTLLFLFTLVFYIGFFKLDHYWRTHKGPWTVQFDANPSETNLVLTINQESLDIRDFKVLIEGETTSVTNLPQTLVFDNPFETPPFGEMFYHDLTYLPGVLALNVMGHEIEILPRILTLNRNPTPWTSPSPVRITPAMKLESKGTNTIAGPANQ